MIRKILYKLREVINSLLGDSPGKESHQQNITVAGCNNNVVIMDGKISPNLILPKNQTNVKHFTRKKRS